MVGPDVWAVVRREYLQRVRSRWFVVATLGAPLVMGALFLIPPLLASREGVAERTIAVVDGTGVLYGRIAPELEAGGWRVREQRWHAEVMTELRERAQSGEIAGFVMLDELTLETGEAILYTTSPPTAVRQLTLRGSIGRAALEYQLEQRGVDAASMLAGGDLRVELLSGETTRTEEPRFLVAYVGAVFIYMVILFYAVAVMRATLEEKTSRIVEVIISSMEPWHLMLGKIFGVGAVGLTQMVVWLTMSLAVVTAGLPPLIAARPELASLEGVQEVFPGVDLLAYFSGFFVCGYFMYSSLYAAVGAMCNSDEEAQQAQLPLILVLVVPILMLINVIQDPMSPLSVGLSLFPLFTPFLMWGRVVGGAVPLWQVGLSFVLMMLAIVGIAWVAGRIYKVGILMAGKRPTLPELWRWVREA